MAVSEVDIGNFGLQILGATRITSRTENSRNARSVNACYDMLRDAELQGSVWKFAIKRAVLAPSTVAPAFGYLYAFPLPADYLRALLPPRFNLDWKFESHEDVKAILTNDGDSINLRYIAQVTDPNRFDPLFRTALGSRVADHCCEEITQSNEKKLDANKRYKDAIMAARRCSALEKTQDDSSSDSWQLAPMLGSAWADSPDWGGGGTDG